mgnify:CR=1 FL=1
MMEIDNGENKFKPKSLIIKNYECMRKFLLLTRLFCVICPNISAELGGASDKLSKKERRAKEEQELEKAITEKVYRVDVDMMTSSLGTIQITDSYSLTIKGDTLISYLPFMGRAESVPYGGGKGLNFQTMIDKYEQQKTKKVTRIAIDAQNDEDNYHFDLDIFPNGSTSLRLRSRNREPISYHGNACPLDE